MLGTRESGQIDQCCVERQMRARCLALMALQCSVHTPKLARLNLHSNDIFPAVLHDWHACAH